MKIFEINGNVPLTGTVRIGGAKNSALALIPVCILTNNPVTLTNVPDITDIDVLCEILKCLNVNVKKASQSLIIDSSNIIYNAIPSDLSSKIRASYYFMASMLARYKKVQMHFPGGCSIGSRPIDQTLKVFKALGATVIENDCEFIIEAKELIGTNINLDIPSVGATINSIIVSTFASGKTVITNAAREPEIIDLALMLNKMGAMIEGYGTSTITITGVSELNGCCHNIIPDRIEAGTYIILGALTGTLLKIDNIIPEHLIALTDKLIEMKADIEINEDNIVVNAHDKLKAVNIKTSGYPGFPTDLQQPISTLLTQARGESIINESIYENRYMNVPYLNKMGSNINIKERIAKILGPTKLKGTKVKATDLRAGASLLLAALKADGTTIITDVEYILRGYEDIIEKLKNIGAKIEVREI